MCVIVVKEKGLKVSKKALKNCFTGNSDGAGFAWHDGKMNHIRKGYMHFKRFYKAYTSLVKDEYPAIIHFRIASSGNIDGGNCHPFPVSDSIRRLRTTKIDSTEIVVAHNGVISIDIAKKKMSDTEQFIIDVLYPLRNILHRRSQLTLMGMVSKFAFLFPDGTIKTAGDFIDEDGIKFSNNSYKYSYDSSIWNPWTKKSTWGYYECEACGELVSNVYSYEGFKICEQCRDAADVSVYDDNEAII